MSTTTKQFTMGAMVSAYTGYLLCEFSEMHEFVEFVMERSVFTHELADKELCEQIRATMKSKGFLEQMMSDLGTYAGMPRSKVPA